jgi:hypothetical protein
MTTDLAYRGSLLLNMVNSEKLIQGFYWKIVSELPAWLSPLRQVGLRFKSSERTKWAAEPASQNEKIAKMPHPCKEIFPGFTPASYILNVARVLLEQD